MKDKPVNIFNIFLEIFKREMAFLLFKRRKFFIFCILFPIVTFIMLAGVFKEPVLRELPIAVIDKDKTDISRELLNKINASPLVETAFGVTSSYDAHKLISKGDAYGVLVIPENFSRDVLGLKGARIYFEYNNHLFLQGSIVRKGVLGAVQNFSAQYDKRYEERKGVPFYAAQIKARPIIFNDNALFNPYMNYRYFFLLGLFPAFMQLFVIGCVTYAFYFEFKKEIFHEISPLVRQAPVTAYIAKAVPYFIIFGFVFTLMFLLMFSYIGAPFRSGFWIVMLASFFFLATCITTGSLLPLVLRHAAFSATAIYAAPAFAYGGITFPAIAMPKIASMWSSFLPLSHYHKILLNETMRGADIAISSTLLDIFYLLGFSFACFTLSIIIMRLRAMAQLRSEA